MNDATTVIHNALEGHPVSIDEALSLASINELSGLVEAAAMLRDRGRHPGVNARPRSLVTEIPKMP